jgi:hypothetical protein
MSTFDNSGLDDVLASIPAMLTVTPAESFILVATVRVTGKTLDAAKRFDISTFAELPKATALYVTRALANLTVVDLLGVITTGTDDPSGELPLRPAVDTFTETLADMGFPDLETVFLPSFDGGARWNCYQHPDHTGLLPTADPAPVETKPTASEPAGVDHESLIQQFTPGRFLDRDRLRPTVAHRVRYATLDDAENNLHQLRMRLTTVEHAIRAAVEGRYPDRDVVIAELIATFTVWRLRIALFAPLAPENELAFEDVLLYLWKLADEPYASYIAEVVAVHACYRGDATTALVAAKAASPPSGVTRLILPALGTSLSPQRTALAFQRSARAVRTDLGLDTQP